MYKLNYDSNEIMTEPSNQQPPSCGEISYNDIYSDLGDVFSLPSLVANGEAPANHIESPMQQDCESEALLSSNLDKKKRVSILIVH